MRTAICVVLVVLPCLAQQPPEDPLREIFFPPELVMQHQRDIGLTDDQRNFLKTQMREAQLRFTTLQFALQDEIERMAGILNRPKVDEKEALAELDKVLAAEREIKRAQIGLLIRIKNNLTPAQQQQLRQLSGKPADKE